MLKAENVPINGVEAGDGRFSAGHRGRAFGATHSLPDAKDEKRSEIDLRSTHMRLERM